MNNVDAGREGAEAWIAAAEAAGEIRVLRRLQPPTYLPRSERPGVRLGLCVDVEATGLDTGADEPIEIAMLPFSYDCEGRIVAIHEPFCGLREPSRPIPPAVTALTGIDAATVRGHAIDVAAVEAFAAPASVVLAHNSAYDRRMLERFAPVFREKPWACSVEDADWVEEGVESAKLASVAVAFGLFNDVRHRAVEDCRLLLEILGRPAPASAGTMLGKVLRSARRGRHRVSAFGPYEAKAALKGAGYRWDPGSPERPKCWYRDVVDDFAVATEREFLARLRPSCRGEGPAAHRVDKVLGSGVNASGASTRRRSPLIPP